MGAPPIQYHTHSDSPQAPNIVRYDSQPLDPTKFTYQGGLEYIANTIQTTPPGYDASHVMMQDTHPLHVKVYPETPPTSPFMVSTPVQTLSSSVPSTPTETQVVFVKF